MKEYKIIKKLSSFNLKEPLKEIYCYQDFNKKKFNVYYNDEIKFPLNLEKMYFKYVKKVKNFFDIIFDIKIVYDDEKNEIIIIYIME